MNRQEIIESLKNNEIKIGTDGFIRFVDVMGEDASIVQAARVSYGEGTKSITDDKGLIRYLMRNRHTTPFEMCEVKIHIRVPMDTWRQWIRHRTANVNEYSTRYSEAINSMEKTDPKEWRIQSDSNKQGSGRVLTGWTDEICTGIGPGAIPRIESEAWEDFVHHYPTPGDYLSQVEEAHQNSARAVYQKRIDLKVAREQARKDLPLSTYTEAYWKCDLHNILHFIGLRMDNHAQLEIREFATVFGTQIIKPLFPWTWEAFEDYRLNAISLSNTDIETLREVLGEVPVSDFGRLDKIVAVSQRIISNKRELSEFVEKWKRIISYHVISDDSVGIKS